MQLCPTIYFYVKCILYDKPTHVSSILEIMMNSSILLELYLCPYLVIIFHQPDNHTHLLLGALKYCQWPVVIFLLKSFHFLDLLISFMHHSCSSFLCLKDLLRIFETWDCLLTIIHIILLDASCPNFIDNMWCFAHWEKVSIVSSLVTLTLDQFNFVFLFSCS